MIKKNKKLQNIAKYFLKIGTLGFGGSVALTNMMHTDLVDNRKWINHDEYVRGLTLSGLTPGPLSAQMAIYIGYIYAGIEGATISAISFILPSFLMVVILTAIYLKYGNIISVQYALAGISAAVIGILINSVIELISKTIKPKLFLWLVLGLAFFYTAFFRKTNLFLFILAGISCVAIYTNKKKLIPVELKNYFLIGVPTISLFIPQIGKLFAFFLKAGLFAFGGGLAIIPFLHTGVVNEYHWLTNKQFLDAMAIAMVTPGPVAISATFIGYVTSGVLGSLIATTAIFLPVYVLVILLTPLFIKHAKNAKLSLFVDGVTAASMGAVCGSIIILGQESIIDIKTGVLAACGFILSKYFKTPTAITVFLAGAVGVILH